MEISNIIIFYSLFILIISSAITTLISRKSEHYLISFLVLILSIGGIFFTLNAELNGIIYIFISILLTIFLFNLNLVLNIKKKENKRLKTILCLIFILPFSVLVISALINNYIEQVSNSIVILTPINNSLSTIYSLIENMVFNYFPAFLTMGVCLLILVISLCGNFNKTNFDGDD